MPRIETDTNQVFRRKYFVAADKVISAVQVTTNRRPPRPSSVIAASRVVVSSQPFALQYNTPLRKDEKGDIHVDVVKKGAEVKGLRINCPCGRHTELDVAYSNTSP